VPKLPRLPKLRLGIAIIALLALIVLVSTIGTFVNSINAPELSAPKPKDEVKLTSFELVTPSQADPQDASVRIVSGQDVTVAAQVKGVREVTVLYGLAGVASPQRATAVPDASGRVEVTLHLPQSGVVYVIDAYGLVADKLIPGWEGGFFDARPAVEAPATLRVKVAP
jgi:Na+-transporting methylmalonyl-CoA/oxaloacetate decarboxylase gamma subunit